MKINGFGRGFLIAIALAAGCNSVDKDTFDGTYSGDAVDSQSSSNVKQITLNVSASGSVVSGAYTLKAIILDVSGNVTGTLTGAAGTWQGDRIVGTYAAFNCFVRSDGNLTLKKK